MTTINEIENFLSDKRIIVAGASRNSKKFGYSILKSLVEKGYEPCPINPNGGKILDLEVAESLESVSGEYNNLYIVTPKSSTDELIREAASRGIKNIWVQQSCETAESEDLAKSLGLNIITKKCLFMFLEPVDSIHKFHRGIVKLFGKYPKN